MWNRFVVLGWTVGAALVPQTRDLFSPPLMPYLVNSSGHTGRQKRLKVHSTRTPFTDLAALRPLSPSGRRRSVRYSTDARVSAVRVVQTWNSCACGSRHFSVGDFCARTTAFENDATFELSREFNSSLFFFILRDII